MTNTSEETPERKFVEAMQQAAKAWSDHFPDGVDTDFQALFENSIRELQEAILDHEPTILLSSLAYDNLFSSSVSPFVPEILRRKLLEQHHIELLQAISLTKQRNTYWSKAPAMQSVDQVESTLISATQAYAIQRMKAAHEKYGELGEIIGSTQLHTLAVRNFAYPNHILQLINELYAPMEKDISKSLGFEPEGIGRMLFGTVALIEARISDEFNLSLLPVLRAKSFEEVKQISSRPELQQAGRAIVLAKKQNQTFNHFLYMYREWWKLRLPALLTLSSGDLKKSYPGDLDEGVSTRIIESWSMEFGATHPLQVEHMMLANPVWDRPFIKLADDQFFLPVGNLVIGFCPRLIWNLVAADPKLAARLPDRKADFLEEQLETIFRSNFPAAEVLINVEWRDEIGQGENDVVVLLPPYAFIIEAKSGAMDAKAKRGAPDSLKESIKKLVEEPADQSAGLISWIKRNSNEKKVKTKYGSRTINCSGINEYVQLSVTLEHFCPQTSNWQTLADLGVVAATSTPVPSVRLTDLLCVFEILSTQCEKLHYWMKRQDVEAVALSNDELGWLSLYLENRLMFEPTDEFLEYPLLPAYAHLFDPYFLREDTQIDVPKPSIAIPSEVAQIVRMAEAEKIDHWIYLGCILLDLWNDQLLMLVQLIEGIRAGKGSEEFRGARYDCIEVSSESENIAFCAALNCEANDSTDLAKQIFRNKDDLMIAVVFGCTDFGDPRPVSFVRVFRRNLVEVVSLQNE